MAEILKDYCEVLSSILKIRRVSN
uniref:Uncharacterized protein n=1 Tax=Rhizophora mucronata TaxID=61149 RepID=A0A2P2PTM1_RHIMU